MPNHLTRAAAGGALLVALAIGGVALAAPSGAAFTTDLNGTVNQNHYAATTDVYLNGGPCNTRGVRLADGDYEFRVTDPSGKTDFTKDEKLSERAFRVSEGWIVWTADQNDHPRMQPAWCKSWVLRVGPFAPASRTGEYKLWIAPRGSNFSQKLSKTDNFRVEETVGTTPPPPPTDGTGGF